MSSNTQPIRMAALSCLLLAIAIGTAIADEPTSLPRAGAAVSGGTIDFGDDGSQWANDGECDDPRFEGAGMNGILLDEDLGRDASDCRKLFESGDIQLKDAAGAAALPAASTPHPSGIDFGSDASQWANDGECDDPRFRGKGMHSILINNDLKSDASDCRKLFESGDIVFRDVYRDDYAQGAPFPVDGIDFGDNSSQWSHDGECDDPRFDGPGIGTRVDEDGQGHDADDCRQAFIAGKVAFRPQDEIDAIGLD